MKGEKEDGQKLLVELLVPGSALLAYGGTSM